MVLCPISTRSGSGRRQDFAPPPAPTCLPPLPPGRQLPFSGIHGGPTDSDPYGRLLHGRLAFLAGHSSSVQWNTSAAVSTSGNSEMVLSVAPIAPTSDASITTMSLPFGSRP